CYQRVRGRPGFSRPARSVAVKMTFLSLGPWGEEVSMIDTYIEELATKTRGRVPAHLRRKVDPDDLVQEVWRRAYTAEMSFSDRTESEVRAYLDQTLGSVVSDLVRHYDRDGRRVAREHSLEPSPDDPAAGVEEWLAADQTSPSGRAGRNEQLARLA